MHVQENARKIRTAPEVCRLVPRVRQDWLLRVDHHTALYYVRLASPCEEAFTQCARFVAVCLVILKYNHF